MDPCKPMMESYLECVEGKTRGLSEGDECLQEAESYKKCRKENNKNTKKKSDQLTTLPVAEKR
jgi:hypothetical protein